MGITIQDRILGGLWGVLVGDALGVPVEFTDRSDRDSDPVTDMRGHGSHDQPAGTWSDDGALTLCTVEGLIDGFSTQRLADLFVQWYHEARWTARGRVFDIGIATRTALGRVASGIAPEQAGGRTVRDNGNGALMRILPLALRFSDRTAAQLFAICGQAARITHGHIRSALACGIYCNFAVGILRGKHPEEAYGSTCIACAPLVAQAPREEQKVFARLLDGGLRGANRLAIDSTGYVVDSLEASIWCVLQGGSFADMTLRAVNLGDDTDSTGAIAGGLAGILAGQDGISKQWRVMLPRQNDLLQLFRAFLEVCPDAVAGHDAAIL